MLIVVLFKKGHLVDDRIMRMDVNEITINDKPAYDQPLLYDQSILFFSYVFIRSSAIMTVISGISEKNIYRCWGCG